MYINAYVDDVQVKQIYMLDQMRAPQLKLSIECSTSNSLWTVLIMITVVYIFTICQSPTLHSIYMLYTYVCVMSMTWKWMYVVCILFDHDEWGKYAFAHLLFRCLLFVMIARALQNFHTGNTFTDNNHRNLCKKLRFNSSFFAFLTIPQLQFSYAYLFSIPFRT